MENGLVASGFAAADEDIGRTRPATSKPLTTTVSDLARAVNVEITGGKDATRCAEGRCRIACMTSPWCRCGKPPSYMDLTTKAVRLVPLRFEGVESLYTGLPARSMWRLPAARMQRGARRGRGMRPLSWAFKTGRVACPLRRPRYKLPPTPEHNLPRRKRIEHKTARAQKGTLRETMRNWNEDSEPASPSRSVVEIVDSSAKDANLSRRRDTASSHPASGATHICCAGGEGLAGQGLGSDANATPPSTSPSEGLAPKNGRGSDANARTPSTSPSEGLAGTLVGDANASNPNTSPSSLNSI